MFAKFGDKFCKYLDIVFHFLTTLAKVRQNCIKIEFENGKLCFETFFILK